MCVCVCVRVCVCICMCVVNLAPSSQSHTRRSKRKCSTHPHTQVDRADKLQDDLTQMAERATRAENSISDLDEELSKHATLGSVCVCVSVSMHDVCACVCVRVCVRERV